MVEMHSQRLKLPKKMMSGRLSRDKSGSIPGRLRSRSTSRHDASFLTLSRSKSAPPPTDLDIPFAKFQAKSRTLTMPQRTVSCATSSLSAAPSRYVVTGTLGTAIDAAISCDKDTPVARLQGRSLTRDLAFSLVQDQGKPYDSSISIRWDQGLKVMEILNTGLYPFEVSVLAKMHTTRKRTGLKHIGEGHIGEISVTSGAIMAREYAVLVGNELAAKVVRGRELLSSWIARIDMVEDLGERENSFCLALIAGIESAYFQGGGWPCGRYYSNS